MVTDEDLLRGRLRSAASQMSVGAGSLAGVEARATQLQRRRNAVRAGTGAFALVAVALVGVVSLGDGKRSDLTDSVVAAEQLQGGEPESAPSAGVAFSIAEQDVADDLAPGEMAAQEVAADEVAPDEMAAREMADEELAPGEMAADEIALDDMAPEDMAADDMAAEELAPETVEPTFAGPAENRDSTPLGGSDTGTVVFATTVSIVQPPSGIEGAQMHYSFSGAHALARTGGNWYAYDGAHWQPVGLPGDMEVVAVDVSRSGRIAVFGVVRPLECGAEQVVAVLTGDKWSYVRVDDDTPPTVGWELLDARVRVTDAAIELERVERLWLDEQCESSSQDEASAGAAAKLVADLAEAGEIQRASRPLARLDGGFAHRWPHVARSDAHSAAASHAGLEWTTLSPPRYSVPALRLTPSRSADGPLHETTVMDVATTVHVRGGMARLQRGGQTWEVCPIADEELDHVNGEVGRAGQHLAVVVGKPEQTLFIVERAE